MKKNLNDFKRLLLTACCTLVLSCGWAAVNEKPFVIPELKQWSGAEGMFTPSGKYVVKGGKNAQEVAKLFAADYHDLVGKSLTPKTGKPSAGDIVLVLQSDKKSARLLGKEGYRLTIGDVTTITASSVEGLVWGTRTVLQLSEQQRSAGFVLPKGSAQDTPAYGLRGFMMDCGRKFIPMSYLRSLVKMMSYYKMNTCRFISTIMDSDSSSVTIGRKLRQPSAWNATPIRDLRRRMAAIPRLSSSNSRNWQSSMASTSSPR